MEELFPGGDNMADADADDADEFISVFEEVNKIFARQTDSRLDVSDISAQPLVSQSASSKPSPAVFLPLYLIARVIVPYFL